MSTANLDPNTLLQPRVSRQEPGDALAQFKRDGYWIDRGVFSAEELARLREVAGEIQERTRRELPTGTRYWLGARKTDVLSREEKGLATWGVNELTRREFFQPELVNVFAHPRVDAVMNALLVEPRAWGIKILWTPKLVGYDLGWHRDQMKAELYDYAQFKPEAQDHVQFNAALETDDCFLVVPGSHRRSLTPEEWHAVREDKTASLPGEVVAELEAGDILYMDAHALHRGRSAVEGRRLTLHYSAQAQWVPLNPWGEEKDFAFVTSEEFLGRLKPAARVYYERLRTAETAGESMAFLKEAAARHGWVREAA